MCIGTEDPFIPSERRLAFEDEMRAGGVDWRMYLFGGAEHSFTHAWAQRQLPGIAYDALTDRRSWGRWSTSSTKSSADAHRVRASLRAPGRD